ncbi:hypothetical protein K438DRAFT_1765733 [Mycena galopus ATCC 62051]|nr:hypothetical protein K438DRAFT_1765733 [Mycena galopus ATCC 62051]
MCTVEISRTRKRSYSPFEWFVVGLRPSPSATAMGPVRQVIRVCFVTDGYGTHRPVNMNTRPRPPMGDGCQQICIFVLEWVVFVQTGRSHTFQKRISLKDTHLRHWSKMGRSFPSDGRNGCNGRDPSNGRFSTRPVDGLGGSEP